MNLAKAPATFGAWVRSRRRQLDLTQPALGRLAGCSGAAVRKIEADERKPSRQLAELLAKALEIPSKERDIFLRMARGVFTDDAPSTSSKPGSTPNNLPALLTSTINRTRDHNAVTGLIKDADIHLVTLIGPPGIGKTRLSLVCGHDLLDYFPQGVWFIDLTEISQADFFIPTLARAMRTAEMPPSPDFTQLTHGLHEKQLLLILDNFEHIVEGAAIQVSQILKACPSVKMLLTSRVPLHIYGEHEYHLQPLSVPPHDVEKSPQKLMQFEAIQLFVARIRQHQANFEITSDNANAIVAINAILEGIPLAVELAAATLRWHSLTEMAGLLQGRDWVNKIGTPARDLPQRQRTLYHVIDWSYTLLDEEQRLFLSRLGVLSGWFDTEAAVAACGFDESRAITCLKALADQSLLMREILQGRPHWRMLQIIREYASAKTDNPDEVMRLLALYFNDKLNMISQNAPFSDQEGYFQINRLSLHSALRWAIMNHQTWLAYPLAFHLEPYWSSLGFFKEGLDLFQQVLELSGEIDSLTRANGLETASDLAWQQHDFDTGLSYARQAVELGRNHRLSTQYPRYLNRLGRIYIEQENFQEAKNVLRTAYELASQNPATLNPGIPLAQLGEIALFEGDLSHAKSQMEGALACLPQADTIFAAMAKTDLAEIELANGNYLQAQHWLRESLTPAQSQIRRLAVYLCALAGYLVLSPEGNPSAAARLYGAVDVLCERAGVILGSFYQRTLQERKEAACLRMTREEWQIANQSGRQWDKEEAIRQAKQMVKK